jgi:hypothetical protein
MGGHGRDLIEILSWHLLGGTQEKTKNLGLGVHVEVGAKFLSNNLQ